MSLVNLFQKRNSKKNKKISPIHGQRECADKNEPIGMSIDASASSEISEILQDLINRTIDLELKDESEEVLTSSNTPGLKCENFQKNKLVEQENDLINSDSGKSILEQIEVKETKCIYQLSKENEGKEIEFDDLVDSRSHLEQTEMLEIKRIKKKRSVSESQFEENLELHRSSRRKYGSESEILAIVENVTPSNEKKELDTIVEKYVNKLIRKSIVNAVKNVKVDNLYQEILRDFSRHTSTESSESVEDFVVGQRRSSNSISELIQLKLGDTENGKHTNFEDSVSQDLKKSGEVESIQNEFDYGDNTAFVGYLADYEDTTSIDDLKSMDEDSSICSTSDGLQHQATAYIQEKFQNLCVNTSDNDEKYSSTKTKDIFEIGNENVSVEPISLNIEMTLENIMSSTAVLEQKLKDISLTSSNSELDQDISCAKSSAAEELQSNSFTEKNQGLLTTESTDNLEQKLPLTENTTDQVLKSSVKTGKDHDEKLSSSENDIQRKQTLPTTESIDDLLLICAEGETLSSNDSKSIEIEDPPSHVDRNLPQNPNLADEEKKINWKVGYLHVKLPPKSRGKTHLKAWKKRRVVIQPDEFVNDPKNPSLVISVYGADSRKHGASFWQAVSCQKAVVYRSSSRTHRYAFTISEEGRAIIHLSAENETVTQEWMAAIRYVLWPPSPFMQLEKMLSGREFDISLIDNEFSYHAGLLGMYGYLSITPRKLILLHPQEGYVIQEWYLNTVDKFQLVPQPKMEDSYKVLAMTTCSDSSTGAGEMLLFCSDAVTLLKSLASTIHQLLTYRSKQDGRKYQKELEEMADWLVAPPRDSIELGNQPEDHYKVPTRQVKSLLDIPNFIFEKTLSPVASAIYPSPLNGGVLEPLEVTKAKLTTTSHDSGISTCHSGDEFLNSSVTSFVIGGGPMTGKSSDSELSDSYTPPKTPDVDKKIPTEEHSSIPLS